MCTGCAALRRPSAPLRDVNAGQAPGSDTYRRPEPRDAAGVGIGVMAETTTDYYELLQISPNAEPETIHRVYRLLAQRFHPDNKETGDAGVPDDPRGLYRPYRPGEARAVRRLPPAPAATWKLVHAGTRSETDVDVERLTRLTLLEVLYTRRRLEPQDPGLAIATSRS